MKNISFFLLLAIFFVLSINMTAPNPPAASQGRFIPLAFSDEDALRLPSNRQSGKWLPLNALSEQSSNFTMYPDALFSELQKSYQKLQKTQDQEQKRIFLKMELSPLLLKGYSSIEGKVYLQAADTSLRYPTLLQLKAETFYERISLIKIAIPLYFAVAIMGFFALLRKNGPLFALSSWLLWLAFFLHTLVLLLRIYILERAPVSNMAETVIYVPWIAMFSGIVLAKIFSLPAIRYASSLTAAILLTILEMTLSAGNLSTIQPVLNSQYWLIIHVLMVVGSYGFFVLAGILGHLFLINCFFVKKNPEKSSRLIAALLQCLYIGTFLLIAGTILGGVWAAESWGRFWDWDPKEAWAFISACGYLMIIHAYRFRHIADFGLAIGSILGLLTISFTWYGVNYILGTGLHSYGFGSGGEIYYYAFLFAEILFVAASGIVISKLGIKGS